MATLPNYLVLRHCSAFLLRKSSSIYPPPPPPPPPQAPVASASTWPVPLCSVVWNRSHQPAAGAGPLHCRANHTGDPLVTVISHIHTCIHTHILHTHTHTPGLLQLCPVGSSLWSCPGNLKKLPHHSKTKLVEICNPRSN